MKIRKLCKQLMVVFLLMLSSRSAFAANQCSSFFQTEGTYQAEALFHSRNLRLIAENFFKRVFSYNQKLGSDFVNEFHQRLSNTHMSDVELYTGLREWLESRPEIKNKTEILDDSKRLSRRVDQLTDLFSATPNRYLDVGAGNGAIARALAKRWKLSAENVMALEVAQYSRESDVSWLQYTAEGKIPLENSSVDSVSVLMVLHHVENQAKLIKEIFRVTAHGGTVVVRETDAQTAQSKLLNKILDEMFYAVFDPNPSVPTPAHYRSKEQWTQLFKSVGFTVEVRENTEAGNPFTPVYFILRKP